LTSYLDSVERHVAALTEHRRVKDRPAALAGQLVGFEDEAQRPGLTKYPRDGDQHDAHTPRPVTEVLGL
jgi:hypothetical protein